MALIDDVTNICNRLKDQGWAELLLTHGLDITASDSRKELHKELTQIDRSLPGFEDFSLEGKRGIEPGYPGRSLLYHVFASPNVIVGPNGNSLSAFPTLAEIEVIENYVYGSSAPSILELMQKAGGSLLSLCVFAYEYRPSPETVHKKHADMCFSRTGVARVGTSTSTYVPIKRGFLPFVENDDHAIRVLPAKYGFFIAIQMKGQENKFGPVRFRINGNGNLGPDNELDFWAPIHKLFNGDECIRGLNLDVSLHSFHTNEKNKENP